VIYFPLIKITVQHCTGRYQDTRED